MLGIITGKYSAQTPSNTKTVLSLITWRTFCCMSGSQEVQFEINKRCPPVSRFPLLRFFQSPHCWYRLTEYWKLYQTFKMLWQIYGGDNVCVGLHFYFATL